MGLIISKNPSSTVRSVEREGILGACDRKTSTRKVGINLTRYNESVLPSDIPEIVEEILASRKYRDLSIPAETLTDLISQEWPRHARRSDALQAIRRKLHNIIAPYLGDPDYPAAQAALSAAFASGLSDQVKTACLELLSAHASTRERLPLLETFYPRLWAVTGIPRTVLDLACALHPFGLPWMGLPADVRYHAYDLHQPRLDCINAFFSLQNLPPLAEKRDILVSPPDVEADVAFFFKEAHRFEQRQKGCNRAFWQALKVKTIIVSLPSSNLTGSHSMLEGQRILVERAVNGLDWKVTEILVGNEIIFCINK